MKVLHLVAGELSGGAARGAYWLHCALRELGVESVLLTNGAENLGDSSVVAIGSSRTHRLKCALLGELWKLPLYLYRKRQKRIFHTGLEGLNFMAFDAYKNASVVHLHWINGLVAMRAFGKIKKPLVWTMRDMWPLTGGCHYALDCRRYRVGCGQCPQLGSGVDTDLSQWVVRNKRACLPKQLKIVGVSDWLTECARESRVFSGYCIETISNNVDTRQFLPIDMAVARNILGIPFDKHVVLVGAQRISDFYKGFDLFVKAIKTVRRRDIHVLVFGEATGDDVAGLEVSYTRLGFLCDIVSLRLAYSAADVFVAPSRMDAFPKTLVEALSCGTPVVCFDATGPRDIVEHQVTGFKAKAFDPEELGFGIQWVLSRDKETRERFRQNARDRAVTRFDSLVIAKQYIAIYDRISASP